VIFSPVGAPASNSSLSPDAQRHEVLRPMTPYPATETPIQFGY
jgi:hypothetical protein